jgi:hypothetical protein
MSERIFTTAHAPTNLDTIKIDGEGKIAQPVPEMWFALTRDSSNGHFELRLNGFNYSTNTKKDEEGNEIIDERTNQPILIINPAPFVILRYAFPTPKTGLALLSGTPPNQDRKLILPMHTLETEFEGNEFIFPYTTENQKRVVEDFAQEELLPLQGIHQSYPSKAYDFCTGKVVRYCISTREDLFKAGILGVENTFTDYLQSRIRSQSE